MEGEAYNNNTRESGLSAGQHASCHSYQGAEACPSPMTKVISYLPDSNGLGLKARSKVQQQFGRPCRVETCYILSIKQANNKKYVLYDRACAMKQGRLPWLTTCKWTTYAQAHVHVKTWERPKRALLMEAAAVINIRCSNNEERRRWIKSPPSLCMFVNNGREGGVRCSCRSRK